MAKMPFIRVFGESPTPEPEPGKGLDAETAGLIRWFIISTGTFIALALLIVLIGKLPPQPTPTGLPSTGEWEALQAAEEAKLNNYSWLNERSGIVRIPIKQAMKVLSEQGLPARELETDEAAPGEAPPAEGEAPPAEGEAPPAEE